MNRERAKQRKQEAGITPGPKGRPRKDAEPREYRCRAGISDSAVMHGKQTAAGFSAIHRKDVRATAKYAVIYRHRKEYPILVMCKFFSVSRSSYYSFVKRMDRPEKDADLAEMIRQQQSKCFLGQVLQKHRSLQMRQPACWDNPKPLLIITSCWLRVSSNTKNVTSDNSHLLQHSSISRFAQPCS